MFLFCCIGIDHNKIDLVHGLFSLVGGGGGCDRIAQSRLASPKVVIGLALLASPDLCFQELAKGALAREVFEDSPRGGVNR